MSRNVRDGAILLTAAKTSACYSGSLGLLEILGLVLIS